MILLAQWKGIQQNEMVQEQVFCRPFSKAVPPSMVQWSDLDGHEGIASIPTSSSSAESAVSSPSAESAGEGRLPSPPPPLMTRYG